MIQRLPTLQEATEHWKANRQAEAREVLERLVALEPKNEQAWLWVARTADSPMRQRQALEKVLAINPQNEAVRKALRERFPTEVVQRHQQIELLLAEARNTDNRLTAIDRYSAVAKLDPANLTAIEALLAAYAIEGAWAKGIQLLQRARQAQPENSLWVEKQVEYATLSRNLNLLLDLDDLLLNHPAVTAEHLLKVAEIFAKEKRYEIVVRVLERASQLDATNQTVLYGLARAYEVTENVRAQKATLRKIADLDRKSQVGQNVMSRLLEEDPYVPLSMRQNTLVAVREAVGLALPFVLLIFLDNGLSFNGIARWIGIFAAIIGAYALVTATSSFEQAIFKPLFPAGSLDEASRYILGAAGSLLLLVALYFSLQNSFQEADNVDHWVEEACVEYMFIYERETGEPIPYIYEGQACRSVHEFLIRKIFAE